MRLLHDRSYFYSLRDDGVVENMVHDFHDLLSIFCFHRYRFVGIWCIVSISSGSSEHRAR